MKTKKKQALLIVVSVLVCAQLVGMHVGKNLSESVSFKWFVYNRLESPQHGDYVMFYSVRDPLAVLPEKVPLLKRIACSSGQEIKADENGFWCDGSLIGERTDPDNMTMYYEGIIPSGMFFAGGDHPRSYDSRLWGLAYEKDIIGVVHPLFF